MRKFYENWMMLDPNPSVMTDKPSNSTSTLAELDSTNSTIAHVELQNIQNQDVANSTITIAELTLIFHTNLIIYRQPFLFHTNNHKFNVNYS